MVLAARKSSGFVRRVRVVEIVLICAPRLVRDALRLLLEGQRDLRVVAEADELGDALALCEANNPRVVLVDLGPAFDAAALGGLVTRSPARVLALVDQDAASVERALAAGAHACVQKDQAGEALADAVRTIARADGAQSDDQLDDADASGDPMHAFDSLTPREREVFLSIVQGKSSREIGKALCLSLKTVETHRSNINRKLGTHSPADLVRIAARHGLDLTGSS
jgi:DNA-binding NarL/FixJ family response regulator